jgi:CO dehydrogenase maturation factor
MVGKIVDPFQGCACSMADIAKDLVAKLVLKDKELLLIDMEAGIESFGRGMERSVNTILIVVEPSYESLALAEKISYMAEGMGISWIRAILNKVPSEEVKQRMIEELDKRSIKPIGTIYFDPQLNKAGFEGTVLGDSKATLDMEVIMDLLVDESK